MSLLGFAQGESFALWGCFLGLSDPKGCVSQSCARGCCTGLGPYVCADLCSSGYAQSQRRVCALQVLPCVLHRDAWHVCAAWDATFRD